MTGIKVAEFKDKGSIVTVENLRTLDNARKLARIEEILQRTEDTDRAGIR